MAEQYAKVKLIAIVRSDEIGITVIPADQLARETSFIFDGYIGSSIITTQQYIDRVSSPSFKVPQGINDEELRELIESLQNGLEWLKERQYRLSVLYRAQEVAQVIEEAVSPPTRLWAP